jgi:chromosome segregation ATPase
MERCAKMTGEDRDNLERRIHDLEDDLRKKENQLNIYLDKIEGLEVEIMKYEEMFDEKAPKLKMKKAKEEKLNLELEAKDREIRELKDRMGYLRMEKIELQKKLDQENKKTSSSSKIIVEEFREKDKAPLNLLLHELQDKINKQDSIIKRLKSKDIGNDEFKEKLTEKDKQIEILTNQLADLKESLEKKPSQTKVKPKQSNGAISKGLLEELQTSLNKVKRQNEELKKKLSKYEKKDKKKKDSKEDKATQELKEKISQLTGELEYKNKEIERLNTSAIHLESLSGPDALKQVVEELTNKLNKSKTQVNTLKQQLKAVENIPTDTLPQGDVDGKLKYQREMASFLQQQLDEAKHALKTKEEEIATIKNEAIRIKRKYEELDNQLKIKEKTTNELKADLDSLKMQTENQTQEGRTISPEFNLRLKELESLVDDLSKQNIQQRLEISQLRKGK